MICQTRKAFSLAEIMVVMLLVSIVAGISAFALIPFYKTYRFRLEVASVYHLVQELQLEALSLQSDMEVRFTKKQDQWIAEGKSDEAVLKAQRIELPHVDHLDGGLGIDVPFTILLYSNGLVYPKKAISFSSRGEKQGLDFTHPPLVKLWINKPPEEAEERIPNRKTVKDENKEPSILPPGKNS